MSKEEQFLREYSHADTMGSWLQRLRIPWERGKEVEFLVPLDRSSLRMGINLAAKGRGRRDREVQGRETKGLLSWWCMKLYFLNPTPSNLSEEVRH